MMALVRGLHLAATLSLLGTAGFIAWILPAGGAVPGGLARRLVRLWWISGVVAILSGLAWFTLQSAAIAGVDDLSDLLGALPVVAEHTRYGNTLMLRLALVVLATLVSAPVRWWRTVRGLSGGGSDRDSPRPAGNHRSCRGYPGRDRRRAGAVRVPPSAGRRDVAGRPPAPVAQPARVIPARGGRCLRTVHPDRVGVRAGPGRHRFRAGAGTDRRTARPAWYHLRPDRRAENRSVPGGVGVGGRQPAVADRPAGRGHVRGAASPDDLGFYRDANRPGDRHRGGIPGLNRSSGAYDAGLAVLLAV